jgi:hypothetical protein
VKSPATSAGDGERELGPHQDPPGDGSVTVVCPVCTLDDNWIIDSRPTAKGRVDRRRHVCVCGVRWTSRATVEPDSIATPISGGSDAPNTTMDGGQTAKPPPTNGTKPPTNSSGGVGGALPSGQVPIRLVSDPVPGSVSDPNRGRARTKTQAKPPTVFSRLVSVFIAAWEDAYREKYPFERQDGVQVTAMLKAHPEYGVAEVWDEMCSRYLADGFWARKRHPLIGLATKAREFAGPAGGGIPVKVAESRETTRKWATRGR